MVDVGGTFLREGFFVLLKLMEEGGGEDEESQGS
jgi:hypothetical protein